MDRRPRAGRIAAGLGLTAGLLGLGLLVSGHSARALSWTASPPALESEVLTGRPTGRAEVVIDGEPTRLQVCRSPQAPGAVLARYRELAEAEARAGTPVLVQEGRDRRHMLIWVTGAGVRKALLTEPDPAGGTRYKLLEGRLGDPREELDLPGGLAAPLGAEVVFAVDEGAGTGIALLEARGGVHGVADRVIASLEAAGFRVDRRAAAALAEHAGQGRVAVPFSAPDRRGLALVSAAGGESRVTLTIRGA